MFSGKSSLNLDSKGRLAIPSRYRARLEEMCGGKLKMTINPNPIDRCVLIYPINEWEIIEAKLIELPEFDLDAKAKGTKRMMLGYAEDCTLDSHGRIRVETSLKEFVGLDKEAIIMGQGNKFELWDKETWNRHQNAWLNSFGDGSGNVSEPLQQPPL